LDFENHDAVYDCNILILLGALKRDVTSKMATNITNGKRKVKSGTGKWEERTQKTETGNSCIGVIPAFSMLRLLWLSPGL